MGWSASSRGVLRWPGGSCGRFFEGYGCVAFEIRHLFALRSPIMVLMRVTRSITRVVAIVVSFWMAALACVIGCIQPAFANVRKDQVLSKTNSVNRNHTAVMPDMDCCNREGPSAPTSDKKSSPHDSISCCPLDARVSPTQKWNPALLASTFKADTILALEFHFASALFAHPPAFAQAFWHSGRDTLLKTRVLRI